MHIHPKSLITILHKYDYISFLKTSVFAAYVISILHKYDYIPTRQNWNRLPCTISILHKYDYILQTLAVEEVTHVFQFYISTITSCQSDDYHHGRGVISILHKYDYIENAKRAVCKDLAFQFYISTITSQRNPQVKR